MDTSSFFSIGDQLRDFLSKQFSPPPGTTNLLAFLGSGIAVEPESFLSDGQFNPARINTWLNIVVDPLSAIVDSEVEPTAVAATQLMDAIASLAVSSAPAGSDVAMAFAKMKSQAMQNMGGTTDVAAAPLNWYDPAQIADWPRCSLTSNTSSPTPADSNPKPKRPLQRPPLWMWRTLPKMVIQKAALESEPVVQGPRPRPALQTKAFIKPGMAAALNAERNAPAIKMAKIPAKELLVTHAAPPQADASYRVTSIACAPSAVALAEPRPKFSNAIMVSQGIGAAADNAVTAPVNTSSLSLSFNYLLVELSRVPWWNDLLLKMDNWYIPGQKRASFIAETDDDQATGIPIALVLTADVQLAATWSKVDRDAAESNSHIGPWALAGSRFGEVNNSGLATLTIPSMQAIACIYRTLPALPPKDDPAATANS